MVLLDPRYWVGEVDLVKGQFENSAQAFAFMVEGAW